MHMCKTTVELLQINDISLPILMSQTAIFSFFNGIQNNVYKITNHIFFNHIFNHLFLNYTYTKLRKESPYN